MPGNRSPGNFFKNKVEQMTNDFEVRGQLTAIFLKRLDGLIVEALIDTSDLSIVESFPNTWRAAINKNKTSYYVRGEKSGKCIYLPRYLLNPPSGMVVDHININLLDNRRANLRILTVAQNNQNLKGSRSNNKKNGFRGICWDKNRQKWCAYLTVNKKKLWLGYFENEHIAAKASSEARAKLMPYSAEYKSIK